MLLFDNTFVTADSGNFRLEKLVNDGAPTANDCAPSSGESSILESKLST